MSNYANISNFTNSLTGVIKNNLSFPNSNNLAHRGIADRIEANCNKIISEHFSNVIPARSAKSIEDISVNDIYIDHKSSDISKDFKMPNLVSIEKLKKLDRQLIFNFIIYDSVKKIIVDTFASDVYELNWNHLAIQNLGNGQLQIKDMEKFLESPTSVISKEQWLIRLQEEAIRFNKKAQEKAKRRQKQWELWDISNQI